MMDLETLSNMYLDGSINDLLHKELYLDDDQENALEHYGILGMKWGIRRTPEQLGHRVKKKDRRYEGETEQQYQQRMARESAERIAKTEAKAKAKSEKRAIREREAAQKRELRSQERIAKRRLKSEENLRKEQAKQNPQQDVNKKTKSNLNKGNKRTPTKDMTDQEIRDAIARLKLEKEYIDLSKKPKGVLNKTVDGTSKLLLQVGRNIAVGQLTKYGNQKVDDFVNKRREIKDRRTQTKIDKTNRELGVMYLPGTTKDGQKVGYDSGPFEDKYKKKKVKE